MLYGAVGGTFTTSDLYTVNITTAVATPIGPIGFALTGLAFRPSDGVLFGLTSNNSASNPQSIITVDTSTGAGTLVGSLGLGGQNLGDLAFRNNDVLYGINNSNRKLYTVNTTTGAATQVSALPVQGSGPGSSSAFSSLDVLYGFTNVASGRFYIVDPATAASTQQSIMSGAPAPAASIGAADFDAADVLYICLVNQANPTYLATIDVTNGVISPIGVTQQNLDAIAWSVTPTPPPGPAVETVIRVYQRIAARAGLAISRKRRTHWSLTSTFGIFPRPAPVLRPIDVTFAPKPRRTTKPSVLRAPTVVAPRPVLPRDLMTAFALPGRPKTRPSVLYPPVVVSAATPVLRDIYVLLAPQRPSKPPTPRLGPPVVVTAVGQALARDIVVVFAPQRRGDTMYLLRRVALSSPVVGGDVFGGVMVSLAPQRRGAPKPLLGRPVVVFPPLIVDMITVTLAPQRRGVPRSLMVRPTVVDQPSLGTTMVSLVPRPLQPQTRSRLVPPVVLAVPSAGELVVRLAWRGRRR